MSMPLTPLSPGSLNRAAPRSVEQTAKASDESAEAYVGNSNSSATGVSSSPFQTDVGQENRVLLPQETPSKTIKVKDSPTKTFTIHDDATQNEQSFLNFSPTKSFQIHDETKAEAEESTLKFSPAKQRQREASDGRIEINESTFKFSPSKQQNGPQRSPTSSRSPSKSKGANGQSPMKLESSIVPDMRPATQALKTHASPSRPDEEEESEHDTPSIVSEDTCFSTFSAVPNVDMTQFANLRPNRSPVRSQGHENGSYTPSASVYGTPRTSRRNHAASTSRSPSPTPRGQRTSSGDGDTTNLLLDFTQQFEGVNRSPSRSPAKRGMGSPVKSVTESNLLAHLNNQRRPSPTKAAPTTPGGTKRNMLNLLDFDLPPQPTPRSIPTITVRELESLKSTYLSEISSLKASLSGREAEVESLKKAVTDAERRVGEAQESLREERNTREHAEKEKAEWEKKGKELEGVLKTVREEYIQEEKEKEELLLKLEESNRAREDAELKAAEASTKANVAQSEVGDSATSRETPAVEAIVAQRVAQQLDEKMENLARELHGVYKKKHETKVATLKKTYEARSEKKCGELQRKIDDLAKQNEELQASKDATFSGTLPTDMGPSADKSADAQRLKEQKTEMEEQRAKIAGLTEEMKSMQRSHAQLMQDLERERVEKGELVAAVDEMLALQSEVSAPSAAAAEDLRRSISRPSGLRGPGFGESRIGKAGGSGLPAPGAGKSRMMSNIERMGSGRGAE